VLLVALAVWSRPAIASVQEDNAGRSLGTVVALSRGHVGQYYETALFRGGLPPYSLNGPAGPLPDGLAIDARGDLSGTPTEAGVYRFSYQAQDASNPPNQISAEAEIIVAQ
jgi:hypothetical protein